MPSDPPTLPTTEGSALLLHNPNCSKSRATLGLLRERGIDFEVRRYLEEPLARAELQELQRRLGRSAREWVRRREEPYSESGLDADSSDEAILEAMAAHPVLMERPIVVRSDAARIGRPPESVLELFD